MSHMKTGKTTVTDLDILRRVIPKFPKLRWMEGQTHYEWFPGGWQDDYSKEDAAYKNGIDVADYGRCEHAIKLEGCAYEIGVVKRKDGAGYSLVWDFYGPGRKINEYLGNDAEKLLVEYQKEYCQQYGLNSGCLVDMVTSTENGEEYTDVILTHTV